MTQKLFKDTKFKFSAFFSFVVTKTCEIFKVLDAQVLKWPCICQRTLELLVIMRAFEQKHEKNCFQEFSATQDSKQLLSYRCYIESWRNFGQSIIVLSWKRSTLLSDWVDAQALIFAGGTGHFVGFVMLWLIWMSKKTNNIASIKVLFTYVHST